MIDDVCIFHEDIHELKSTHENGPFQTVWLGYIGAYNYLQVGM